MDDIDLSSGSADIRTSQLYLNIAQQHAALSNLGFTEDGASGAPRLRGSGNSRRKPQELALPVGNSEGNEYPAHPRRVPHMGRRSGTPISKSALRVWIS